MKETEPQTVIINFNLTHRTAILLMLAVLGVVLLGYLAWGGQPATAAGPQAPSAGSTGLRQYYLTAGGNLMGNQALTACEDGYHMASLWEIMDTSNLEYNRTYGFAFNEDQGNGPPNGSSAEGWVRTGYYDFNESTPGRGNCYTWTISSTMGSGTVAFLDENWTTINVWQATTLECDTATHVWCVED